mgnify:CR=1 FL=1
MMGISLLINVLNADAHNGAVWFHTVLFLFYLKKSYIKNGESMAFSVKLKYFFIYFKLILGKFSCCGYNAYMCLDT